MKHNQELLACCVVVVLLCSLASFAVGYSFGTDGDRSDSAKLSSAESDAKECQWSLQAKKETLDGIQEHWAEERILMRGCFKDLDNARKILRECKDKFYEASHGRK